jgi:hypothetical protein
MEKPRRPFSVTLLVLLVLIVAVFNLIRMLQTLTGWEFLTELMQISPVYLAASGLIWGVAGLLLAIWTWLGARRASRLIRLAIPMYSLYYWLDRLFLSGYPERNVNWPFSAGVNLLIFLWSYWILSRKRVKIFFGETYEK